MIPKILAFDLGTTMGVSNNFKTFVESESITLATDDEIKEWTKQRLDRRHDPRIERFLSFARQPVLRADVIVFEDVQFSSFTKQTQLWASFRTALWTLVQPKQFIQAVPVATLKLFAAGYGKAQKYDMMKAMVERESQRYELQSFKRRTKVVYSVSDRRLGLTLDDNAVDSYWLLQWARQHVKL